MDREKQDPDPDHGDEMNSVGAAGQNADPNVGTPVSGMPAGGPDDLGAKAADAKGKPAQP